MFLEMIMNRITKHLYRKKSIAIIIDNKNNFLIIQPQNYSLGDWNLCGGGIEIGETEEQGLLRELQEELRTDKFKIIYKCRNLHFYNWSIRLIIKLLFKKKQFYIGQSQRHFIVKFIGNEKDIKPDPSEIRKVKWIRRSQFKKYLKFPNQLKTVENVLKEYNTKLSV